MNRDFCLLTDHTPTHYRTASVGDLQASNLISLTVSDFSKTKIAAVRYCFSMIHHDGETI